MCQAHGFVYEKDPELVALLRSIVEEADSQHWNFFKQEPGKRTQKVARSFCVIFFLILFFVVAPLPTQPVVNIRLLEYHTYVTGGDLTVGFDKHYDGGRLL